MSGPAIIRATVALRRQAQSLMVDRCDIHRNGGTVWDEEAQESVTLWVPVHLDVPCNLDEPPVRTRAMVTGELVTPGLPVVKIPVDRTGVEPDDRVTITAVHSISAPDMLGARIWVTHNRVRTTSVQHRLECRWSL